MHHPRSSIAPDRNRPTPPADLPGLDTLFRQLDIGRADTLIAAVSGGSDSLALLHLLKSYLAGLAAAPRLVAVTVDHGLRAEAANEARHVAALCARMGVSHETRRWEGPKPVTGIMAAAREARYRLLADAAHAHGARFVLTGHTSDDQVETLIMQGSRSSKRSAGMARATLFDQSVWFVRPLLAVRREVLRKWLVARSIGWIEDPSNTDSRFERVRVRQEARRLDARDVAAMLDDAASAGRERENRADRLAEAIGAHVRFDWPGLLTLPVDLLGDETELRIELPRIMIGVAGGLEHFAPRERVAALVGSLAKPGARGTLGRAVASHRPGLVHFQREMRDLPQAKPLEAGLWDGRFRIRTRSERELCDIVVQAGAKTGQACATPTDERPHVARLAEPTLPVAVQRGTILKALDLRTLGIEFEPTIGPWSRYLPLFDLAAARALAVRIGAAVPPLSPWRDHNEALSKETA